MIDLLTAGGVATLGWSAAVATVSAEAIRRAIVRGRGRGLCALESATATATATATVTVLVVRPCAGSETRLFESLCSITRARGSFSMRYRIAVASAADGAFPAAIKAAEALRAEGLDAEVVLTAARGPNRKVAQIEGVLAAARAPFDVLLVADSDVDLEGAALDALVAPLGEASAVDAVWAPPAELGAAETLADHASAAVLGASLHAFVLLAGLDRGGLVGKLFAVKRAALEAIGGLGSLGAHLGEDMELARRLRARGGAIEVAPVVARSVIAGRRWEQVVARFARWLMVIRAQRPALLPSYPLLFFATPLILLLSAICAVGAPHLAAAAALLALASRLAVALAASRAACRTLGFGRAVIDAVLADFLLAAAFARALWSREVVWRDNVITIDRAGLAREKALEVPHAG